MADPIVSFTTVDGAVAVTPHHLASRAAIDTINRGGNAVDGAIAANAVLGVVLPTTCGIGGDLFALIHGPGMDRPLALNASGRGGSGLDPEALRAVGQGAMPFDHPAAVTVPGCVDGWFALGERLGRLPVGEVLEPALHHAEQGFQTSEELADALERLAPRIGNQPSAPELYPEGRIPMLGEATFRDSYAASLRRIVDEGRDGFYRGPTAEAIVAATRGALSLDDLAANTSDWVEPIDVDVFGATAWSVPPNSQGYAALAAAWLTARIDPPADPEDPAFHHAVVEAYRLVAAELDETVADPVRAPLDPHELLNPDRLEGMLDCFEDRRAAVHPPTAAAGGGTAYLCVIDGDGLGVSLIQSNFTGIGSGISAGSTGIWLHNRGAGFNLKPGHPNEAEPQRRPFHTLSPTLWTVDGRLEMLLGTRGGHQQPQYLAQTAALLRHAGLEPAAAQLFPRWHIDDPAGESQLQVEGNMAATVVDGLTDRRHRVVEAAPWQQGWGPVSIITVDAGGHRIGAADPRISTATAAS